MCYHQTVPYSFPPNASYVVQEDGVLIVMQNSTVISLLVNPKSPTGWGEPQMVKWADSDDQLIAVLDVRTDPTLKSFARPKGALTSDYIYRPASINPAAFYFKGHL